MMKFPDRDWTWPEEIHDLASDDGPDYDTDGVCPACGQVEQVEGVKATPDLENNLTCWWCGAEPEEEGF